MFAIKKQSLHPSATDTLIGEGSLFEGKVKSEASIRIEGQVMGDVESAGDVTVGEHGLVRSHVTARNLIVAGTVHGDVDVKEKLTITSTGRLRGNTNASFFIIEEGGVFQGTSRMEGKDAIQVEPGDAEQDDKGVKPFQPSFPDTAVV